MDAQVAQESYARPTKKVIGHPFVMPENLEAQAWFWGWLLSQMLLLKNDSSANGVYPREAEVLCPAVSPNAGKKPGSPQPVSPAQSGVQGKFHEYQGTRVRTTCAETYLRFQMFQIVFAKIKQSFNTSSML